MNDSLLQIAVREAEKRGYAKGYGARAYNKWPLYALPHPPEPIVREMYEAARKLRDTADSICSTLSPDDEISMKLDPVIEAVDNARRNLRAWLVERSITPVTSGTEGSL